MYLSGKRCWQFGLVASGSYKLFTKKKRIALTLQEPLKKRKEVLLLFLNINNENEEMWLLLKPKKNVIIEKKENKFITFHWFFFGRVSYWSLRRELGWGTCSRKQNNQFKKIFPFIYRAWIFNYSLRYFKIISLGQSRSKLSYSGKSKKQD